MADKKKLTPEELKNVNGGDSDFSVHLYAPHPDGGGDGLVHFGYKGDWNKVKPEFCEKCNAEVLVEVTTDYAAHKKMHRCTRDPSHIWYVDT